MFSIVEFKARGKTKPMDVIPTRWMVNGSSCLWPPKAMEEDLYRMVNRRDAPEKNWRKFACRILCQNGMCLSGSSCALLILVFYFFLR